MKYYFISYWFLEKNGADGLGQALVSFRRINIKNLETMLRIDMNFERVTLLSVIKLTKKEYKLNKEFIR